MYTVPDINLLPFLPEVLDGFFQILADPDQRIREMCEAVLGEFLKSIVAKPDQAELPFMVNILIVHAQSQGKTRFLDFNIQILTIFILDEVVQYIALVWLREFLSLNGTQMLQFASGYLTAVLPCLSCSEEHRKSK